MGFLRKLFGTEKSNQCNFRGKVIPVTKNVEEFVRIVRDEKKAIGLLLGIKDFTHVYGRLLHSAGGTGLSHPLHISATTGPCYVICAQCEAELDEATIAMLGPDSVMAAFGVAPVNRCKACGSTNVLIVSAGRQTRPEKKSASDVPGKHASSPVKPAAVKNLPKKGAESLDSLIAALHDPDLKTCKAAARKLGQIGDPRAIDPLVNIALGWYDKSLRAEADKALLAIGKPALPSIIAGMEQNPPVSNASREAADLLGRMGDPRAVAPLAAELNAASKFGRSDYIQALGKIGGEQAAKVLVEALQYEDNRLAAARWLERIGKDAVAPLIAILGEGKIGKTAASVLIKIGTPAVELLTSALEDPDPAVRKAASGALQKIMADKDPEQVSISASDESGKRKVKPRKKRIEVPHRGCGYDSAPLLIEEDPDLEQLFADPPVIQKPTEQNREFWASEEAGAQWRRMTLVAGFLQHPKPEVRLATLELMEKHGLSSAAGLSQLIFDLLATDQNETVRREVARITWLSERDVNCEYAVNKAKDEIAYGSENGPVGPTRARKALELLVEASPDEDAKKALEHLISLPWP